MTQLTKNNSLLALILLYFSLNLNAGQIQIRLFASSKPESAIFKPIAGDYALEIPGSDPIAIPLGEPVLIYKDNDRIIVKIRTACGLSVDSVKINGAKGGKFSLTTVGTDSEMRYYEDNLLCRNDKGIFLLLNETEIEKLIPGIVRAEGGAGRHPEFYKTQAIITRTFAYRNIEKHLNDGFSLCDDIHCQAYHGVTEDSAIKAAVESTADMVITDSDSVLILAAFHSNCGGETASASEAWVTDVPYLKKVTDPYCLTSLNAWWSKTVTLATWKAFLTKNGYTGSMNDPSLLIFSQKEGRKRFFEPVDSLKVPVTVIRSEFSLRSTFFSFSPEGSALLLKGRGYGHGVGLCQEGAMVMATSGKTCGEIISFYYKNVQLMRVKDARLPPVVF